MSFEEHHTNIQTAKLIKIEHDIPIQSLEAEKNFLLIFLIYQQIVTDAKEIKYYTKNYNEHVFSYLTMIWHTMSEGFHVGYYLDKNTMSSRYTSQ